MKFFLQNLVVIYHDLINLSIANFDEPFAM